MVTTAAINRLDFFNPPPFCTVQGDRADFSKVSARRLVIGLSRAFYWDMNDATRAFSRRFQERLGRPPSTNQAGVYLARLAYLHAVACAGTDDARQVVPEMKRQPIQKPLFGAMTVRQDGRALHGMHLFAVKKPEESRGAWDYYKLVDTIPGDQAFRPISEGNCPMVP